MKELDRLGIIRDISHLAEESFWNLMDLTGRPVIASHSNCRAIVGEVTVTAMKSLAGAQSSSISTAIPTVPLVQPGG